MRSRLLAGTVAGLLLATPAFAEDTKKPKRPANGCALSDPIDDTRSSAFDIVCAKLAVGATAVVVVLRVDDLTDEPLYEGVAGAEWTVTFSARGADFTVVRRRLAGVAATYSYEAPGEFVVSESRREITWRIERSSVPELARKGVSVKAVSATATGLLSRDGTATRKSR